MNSTDLKRKFRLKQQVVGILLAASSSSLLLMGAPQDAFAARCDISTLCAQTAKDEGSKTRDRISTMERNLIQVITEYGERILAAIREQTGALTASETQNTQLSGQNAQKVEQASKEFDIRKNTVSVDCVYIAGTRGGRGGGMSKPSSLGSNNAIKDSGLSENTQKAIRAGIVGTDLPPKDTTVAQATIGVGACVDFADPNSAMGKLCGAVGAPKQGRHKYLNADIDPRSLLEGPESLIKPQSILSVPETGPEAGARQAYINTLFNAKPVAVPDEKTMANLPPNLSAPFLGMYREYIATKKLAEYSTNLYTRLSTIDPSTKEALDAIKLNDSPFYSRFFQGIDSQYHANGVSPLTLLELQVESRVGNSDWLERMSAASPPEKLNEIMMMQALGLRIQYRQLMAQYQTNILLGKVVDLQAESVYRPRLDEYHETHLSVMNAAGSAQGRASPNSGQASGR